MGDYFRSVNNDWFKHRVTRGLFLVMAAFVLLTLRLAHLQIMEGNDYSLLSENNCIRLQNVEPSRGLIFDRYGYMLVDNRPTFNLYIIPRDAKPLKQTLKRLARILNKPENHFLDIVRENRRKPSYKPICLKEDIRRDELGAIEVYKFDLPGIYVKVDTRRHYLKSKSGSHLIGYLSEINERELKSTRYPDYESGDYIGKFGVEKLTEPYLRGKRGGRQVEVDVKGQVVRVLKTVEAEPGHNVYLTIDQQLQELAEELLKGKAGAVAAMNPETGGILAMASSPTFDQNAFVSGLTHKKWSRLINNPDKPLQNKVLQGEYPPASTYKIVTAIAGLEEGVIDEDTTFFCPGYHRFGNRVYHCWKRGGHGNVNVVDALARSCDVFFYQVGSKVGVDRLAEYAHRCGLGKPTGIELGNEAAGLIPTSKWKVMKTGIPWQRGETLSIAIGQGYDLVTPIQMLVLISAMANGGTLYKPYVIDHIESYGGQTRIQTQPMVNGKLNVSKKTMELVNKGLWKVVNSRVGTAKMARLKKYEIYGKTGTAQIISKKLDDDEIDESEIPDEHKPHAWFVSYAGSKAGKIAVAVIVEHGEHGSSTASPIARELIKYYLETLTRKNSVLANIHDR